MSIRDMARRVGGEEMVKEVDWAFKLKDEMEKEFRLIIDGATKGGEDGTDRQKLLIQVALTEALSKLFAQAAIKTVVDFQGGEPGEAIVQALKSVTSNANLCIEDRAAKDNDVLDLIKRAAKKDGGE